MKNLWNYKNCNFNVIIFNIYFYPKMSNKTYSIFFAKVPEQPVLWKETSKD